jgi:hypothetical protein
MQFARGARGDLVRQVQAALGIGADGSFGGGTEAAVRTAQVRHGLPATGGVDATTWTAITSEPFPVLFERCLALTAAFEGHGYSLAAGNFDGAGITFGIIGFTAKSGSLARVINLVPPADLEGAFGNLRVALRMGIDLPPTDRLRWADSISAGSDKGRLQPAWATAFTRLGEMPSARVAQRTVAESSYWAPSQRLLERTPFLTTPRAAALFFDAHVQQGGIRESAVQAAKTAWAQSQDETAALTALADAQALAAPRRWREDVRSRRRCVATGAGTVHGRSYDLTAWGLA